jgi:hypothetical protein
MVKIYAPFTEEQCVALNQWQNSPYMHPFTCGDNRGDEEHRAYALEHREDLGQLVATRSGWACPVCGYKQNWAHDFMLDMLSSGR